MTNKKSVWATLSAIDCSAKVEQKGKRLIIVSGDIMCPKRNNIIIAKAMIEARNMGYIIMPPLPINSIPDKKVSIIIHGLN